jgi:hypothetical protein
MKTCQLRPRRDDRRVLRLRAPIVTMTVLTACAATPRREDPLVRAARARLGAPAVDDAGFLAAVLSARSAAAPSSDPGYLRALATVDGRLVPSPRPGAIVFFAQREAAFHAGVVEKVDDRRITFFHAARGRVRRGVCDPLHPSLRRDARGRIVNTYLVPRRPDDLPGTHYLCGQLLAGYARF